MTVLTHLSPFYFNYQSLFFTQFFFETLVACRSLSLASLSLSPLSLSILPLSPFLLDPRHSLSLSLPLEIPLYHLAVMNSEPFRINQLGQINETFRGDKLCVRVRL